MVMPDQSEVMTTLHIEHAITDFTVWQAAFQSFAPAREQAGVRAYTVRQPVDDPHYVVIDLEFDAPSGADAFNNFLHTKVWSVPSSSPALIGAPTTRILATRATSE